ncbi:MAG: hypothetical protein HYX69_17475 [Planctomycetia bacterium]|nr:hypothetical protein [Planctomycetia bacterium]
MIAFRSIDAQTFMFGIVLGIVFPLLLYWLLYRPLHEFLKEIFHSPAIEQFWLRVVLIGFLASTLAVAVVFQPPDATRTDEVAFLFYIGDRCKQMLDSLIFAMLTIFLPLLAAYTILHVRRRGPADGARP